MNILRWRSRARLGLAVSGGACVLACASSALAGQQCATGGPLAGVDLNPDSSQPNWASAKTEITFGIIKASQGTTFTASGFAQSWAAMKAAGVVRGAYHFFDPTVSGVDQANFFLGIVGTIEAGDLPPTLDIECPTSNNQSNSADCLGNGTSGDATGAQITQGMNDWIHTIVAKTGRKPLIYTYGSYFADDGVDTTGLEAYPLWLADYSGMSCFDVPSPWTSATFWQYGDTGSVSGISGAVDQDYFLGDLAQLTALTAGATVTIDAGSGGDSGPGSGDVIPDAGGTVCTIANGDKGECLDVTLCDSLGGTYTPMPNFCPGAANIQCCTGMPASTTHDAGVGADAKVPDGSIAPPPGSGAGTDAGSGSGTGSNRGDGGGAGAAADGGSSTGGDILSSGSRGGCAVSRAGGGDEGRSKRFVAVALLLTLGAARRRKRRSTSRSRGVAGRD